MDVNVNRTEEVQCNKLCYVVPQCEVTLMENEQHLLTSSADGNVGDIPHEEW